MCLSRCRMKMTQSRLYDLSSNIYFTYENNFYWNRLIYFFIRISLHIFNIFKFKVMEIIDRVSSRSIEMKTVTDIYHIQLLPTDLLQIVKVNTSMGICHSAMYYAFSIDLVSSNSTITSRDSSRVARNCFLLFEMPNPEV